MSTTLFAESTVADFSQDTWWIWVLKAVFIIVYLILSVILALWVERRGLGRMQTRRGPNRVGPWGFFQAFADATKLLIKEDMWLAGAEKVMYFLAPVIAATCAFTIMAVLPMGPSVSMFHHMTPLQLTDSPVAVLFVLAVASLGEYGLVFGGWAAHSTLPLYGSVRSATQMISYELALGLSLVSVFISAGSMSTSGIVAAQQPLWNVITLFPAFCIYLVAMFGETNRLPFDLPEAEGELVAGHHTEYSSMKFGWYYLSEYINMLNVSMIAATCFLGGWQAGPIMTSIYKIWGGDPNVGWMPMLWFFLKTWFFMFIMIWVRATLLRMRYDHFMKLGWKILIPAALLWLFCVIAIQGVAAFATISRTQMMIGIVAVFIVLVVLIWIFAGKEDRQGEPSASSGGFIAPSEEFDALRGRVPCAPSPWSAASAFTEGTAYEASQRHHAGGCS